MYLYSLSVCDLFHGHCQSSMLQTEDCKKGWNAIISQPGNSQFWGGGGDNGCSEIHLKEQMYKLIFYPIFFMIIKIGIKNIFDSDMDVLAEWKQQLLHF